MKFKMRSHLFDYLKTQLLAGRQSKYLGYVDYEDDFKKKSPWVNREILIYRNSKKIWTAVLIVSGRYADPEQITAFIKADKKLIQNFSSFNEMAEYIESNSEKFNDLDFKVKEYRDEIKLASENERELWSAQIREEKQEREKIFNQNIKKIMKKYPEISLSDAQFIVRMNNVYIDQPISSEIKTIRIRISNKMSVSKEQLLLLDATDANMKIELLEKIEASRRIYGAY